MCSLPMWTALSPLRKAVYKYNKQNTFTDDKCVSLTQAHVDSLCEMYWHLRDCQLWMLWLMIQKVGFHSEKCQASYTKRTLFPLLTQYCFPRYPRGAMNFLKTSLLLQSPGLVYPSFPWILSHQLFAFWQDCYFVSQVAEKEDEDENQRRYGGKPTAATLFNAFEVEHFTCIHHLWLRSCWSSS